MFFPYKDDNPRVLYPFVTYSIIILNIIVFLFQFYVSGNNPNMGRSLILKFGFVPNNFNPMDIITSMFMHGGFGHIIGNMWFLYIFGDNIESILGHIRFLNFYVFCGIAATMTQFFIDSSSAIPMVGASGAIAGILGAYMLKFPKAKVYVLAIIIFFITRLIVPARIVLGFWFLIQLSEGLNNIGINTTGGVAWFAHIGGFIFGIGTIRIFQTFRFKYNEEKTY